MFSVTSYTKRPAAGEAIEFLWTKVILGGKNPLFVELICTLAEGSGEAVPIAMESPRSVRLMIEPVRSQPFELSNAGLAQDKLPFVLADRI